MEYPFKSRPLKQRVSGSCPWPSERLLSRLAIRLPNIITTLLDDTMLQVDFKVNTRYERQAWEIGRFQIIIGLLQLAVTWYKIRHAGEQAYYYSRTGTAKQCYFILSSLNFLCFGCPSVGIIISLPSSMANFVPCDR